MVERAGPSPGEDDGLAIVRLGLDRVDRFADHLDADPGDPAFGAPRATETTGRALGTTELVWPIWSDASDGPSPDAPPEGEPVLRGAIDPCRRESRE